MKKVFVISIVMLFVCAMVAMAGASNWLIAFDTTRTDGSGSGGGGIFGLLDGTIDPGGAPADPFGTDTLAYAVFTSTGQNGDIRDALSASLPQSWTFNVYSKGPAQISTIKVAFNAAVAPTKGTFTLTGGATGVFTAANINQGVTFNVAGAPSTAPTQFTLTYSESAQTPEPGSMLALGSGLVGLLGFAIRRRK